MPKSQPFKIVMHYPQTEDGIRQLSRRVAQAHADAVIHKVNGTRGSVRERIELMKAVNNAAKRERASPATDELSR
ncbi:hypothetical protein ADH66_16540 [Acutalibacter muris]|uniref:Uncharacterized protein n=1 Tax=Acutalibacter muris TaxID=1796620 RepID=A0ABN5A944_9FIRM|nr:hypothetical protein A4V00_11840 [Hungateiclostridiaceae bacterium KB18]ASB42129.1 hypothetical protein ADH66_16540 [Acutalibacter muris]